MTRSLSTPLRRRLSRAPVTPRRADHAGDLAPLELRLLPPRPPAEAAPIVQVGRAGPDADRALQSLALENAMLARQLGRVQRRCSQWRDECVGQVDRLEAHLMRSRAAVIIRDTQIAALRDTLDALHKRAAVWLTNEELVRRIGDLRARNRLLEGELAQARRPAPTQERPAGAAPLAANDGPGTAPPGPPPRSTRPRRVLCVGGRARQIPVYRALVERHGGTLDHVDGSNADDLARLERLLAEADVVILQAGYACQGACRAVERHCALHAKQCIWLDKPCVLGFERSLMQAVEAGPRP